MEMRRLGDSGVRVSNLCLGTMMFGSMGNQDVDDCVRIVHRAMDAGINFIDTADVYSRGQSEEVLAKALKGRRDEVVLATKFFNPMSTDLNHRGSSRRWIMTAVEDSLRRLDTDYIDLYQMHRFDETVDIDETLGALSDLVRDGKVRMIGSSTFPAERIVEARWSSDRRGHVPLRCEQPPYSILVRGIERDVLPTAQRYGMGVIVWSPLNGGWLTGKYQQGASAPEGSRMARFDRGPWRMQSPATERKLEIVDALATLAEDAGVSLIELSIAFTLCHPAVTSAIIGPRTIDQLESQLPAAAVQLGEDVLDAIDALVPPGHTVTVDDISFEPRALRAASRRR